MKFAVALFLGTISAINLGSKTSDSDDLIRASEATFGYHDLMPSSAGFVLTKGRDSEDQQHTSEETFGHNGDMPAAAGFAQKKACDSDDCPNSQ